MENYIPDAETKVIVDASPIEFGAILSQSQRGEVRLPLLLSGSLVF